MSSLLNTLSLLMRRLLHPSILVLIPILFVEYFHITHITDFRFIDEFIHFANGALLDRGFAMYADMWHNHQPFMHYISQAIFRLALSDNSTLFEVIKHHRIFVAAWSLLWSVILIMRFRTSGAMVALTYEVLKYYMFGHLFMGESVIAFPLIYLVLELVALYRAKDKQISAGSAIVATLLVWFIIFTREPYIPLALVLWVPYVLHATIKVRLYSIVLFGFLSAAVLLNIGDMASYFNQVFVYNARFSEADLGDYTIAARLYNSLGLLPRLAFSGLVSSEIFYVVVSMQFLFMLALWCGGRGKSEPWQSIRSLLPALLILILAGIRLPPGEPILYTMYRGVTYYAVLWSLLFANVVMRGGRNISWAYVIGGVSLLIFVAPTSYLRQPSDVLSQYDINYSAINTAAIVINESKTPQSTLMLHGVSVDVLAIVDVTPAYVRPYYIPWQGNDPAEVALKEAALTKNPPTYYLESECESQGIAIPRSITPLYVQVLKSDAKSTCVFVRSSALSEIKKIEENGYIITKSLEVDPTARSEEVRP